MQTSSFSCSASRRERRLRNEAPACAHPAHYHRRSTFRKTACSAKRAYWPVNTPFPARVRTTNLGPFGELLRATGPMAKANPFRFSTKYQDDETDMLYYGYRYYSASTGRWLSRDPLREISLLVSIDSSKQKRPDSTRKKLIPDTSAFATHKRRCVRTDPDDTASLYAFVWNHPIGRVDVLGLDVYKVVIYRKDDACCGCAHHRVIVGDNGNGGFYMLDVQNPTGRCRGDGKIVYDGSGAGSAENEVTRLTQNRLTSSSPDGEPGGYEDGHVSTSSGVDALLADLAAADNGKVWDYTFIWNDCGTFANQWLKDARDIQSVWGGD